MFTSVYILRDPRTNEIKYVGVTNGCTRHRLAQHIYDRCRTRRGRWVAELFALELRPIMEVVECVPTAQRDEAEKRWIKRYRAQGIDLLNATRGGKGHTGPMSESAKEKLRKIKTGRRMTFADPVGRALRISASMIGITRSPETRAKLAAASRGRSVIPPEVQARARGLRASGMSVRAVSMQLGYKWDAVNRVLQPIGEKR